MAVEKLQSFFGGVMTGIKPDLLPPFCSPAGQNAVIDRIAEQKGRVRRRKGAVARTCSPITGEPAVLGIFHFPTADQDQILVIADDGTLNVEGDMEFECPGPVPSQVVDATPSFFVFKSAAATAEVGTGEPLVSFATPAMFKWGTTVGTQPENFCLGGWFGHRFNVGNDIAFYFGNHYQTDMSEQPMVQNIAGGGVDGSYCIASIVPNTMTWVEWVPVVAEESEYIGCSVSYSFCQYFMDNIAGSPALFWTQGAPYGAPDVLVGMGAGITEGTSRFKVELTDADNQFYATWGDDIEILPNTFYSIYLEIQCSTVVESVVQADGYVNVWVGETQVLAAPNLKYVTTPAKTSGNNRVGAFHFEVVDKIDDICITPF
jgi:hypothetical protein